MGSRASKWPRVVGAHLSVLARASKSDVLECPETSRAWYWKVYAKEATPKPPNPQSNGSEGLEMQRAVGYRRCGAGSWLQAIWCKQLATGTLVQAVWNIISDIKTSLVRLLRIAQQSKKGSPWLPKGAQPRLWRKARGAAKGSSSKCCP